MENLTIQQIKDKRNDLEDKINALIYHFKKETNVEINISQKFIGHQISVHIEIKL